MSTLGVDEAMDRVRKSSVRDNDDKLRGVLQRVFDAGRDSLLNELREEVAENGSVILVDYGIIDPTRSHGVIQFKDGTAETI